MNAATSQAVVASQAIEALESQAVTDGFMDADGFFTMSDAEFELSNLQTGSRALLEQRLAEPSLDEDTVAFLRDFLVDTREVHFQPFTD